MKYIALYHQVWESVYLPSKGMAIYCATYTHIHLLSFIISYQQHSVLGTQSSMNILVKALMTASIKNTGLV
jgi:hypothetical protein